MKIDWHEDLQDSHDRDFIDADGFNALMSRLGISRDTTIVLYGDKNNWWAAYAYWFFRYMGHDNVKIMDGGRRKWEEESREMSRDDPTARGDAVHRRDRCDQSSGPTATMSSTHIGYKGRQKVGDGGPLVDVRSPGEYSGELLHMPDYPQEGAMRGGHIPGAANIPWAQAVAEDGTFKPASELKALYEGKGIKADKEVVVYCRIGERSSHTWFVLHELLGYPKVRNYDGSWTEWGNVIGVPIER